MLTSLMPSSWMASSAMVMFSRACGCDCGRLLCRSFLFCRVSTSATSLQEGVRVVVVEGGGGRVVVVVGGGGRDGGVVCQKEWW